MKKPWSLVPTSPLGRIAGSVSFRGLAMFAVLLGPLWCGPARGVIAVCGLRFKELGAAKGELDTSVGERPAGESPTGERRPKDSDDVMLVAVLRHPKLPLRSPDDTDDMLPCICGGFTDSRGTGLLLDTFSRRRRRSPWLDTWRIIGSSAGGLDARLLRLDGSWLS